MKQKKIEIQNMREATRKELKKLQIEKDRINDIKKLQGIEIEFKKKQK